MFSRFYSLLHLVTTPFYYTSLYQNPLYSFLDLFYYTFLLHILLQRFYYIPLFVLGLRVLRHRSIIYLTKSGFYYRLACSSFRRRKFLFTKIHFYYTFLLHILLQTGMLKFSSALYFMSFLLIVSFTLLPVIRSKR